MTIYLDFTFSALLLLALVSVYDFFTTTMKFPSATFEVGVSGIAIGVMTIVILSNPVHVREGIFFDARWVLLSCCAIFLNWRIVVIGGLIAAIYRFWQGGAGAIAGISTVSVSILIGFLWRYTLVTFRWRFRWYMHYIFAVFLELCILLVIYIVLPGDKGTEVVKIIMYPLLLMFPIASTILSLLLQHHFKKGIVAFN